MHRQSHTVPPPILVTPHKLPEHVHDVLYSCIGVAPMQPQRTCEGVARPHRRRHVAVAALVTASPDASPELHHLIQPLSPCTPRHCTREHPRLVPRQRPRGDAGARQACTIRPRPLGSSSPQAMPRRPEQRLRPPIVALPLTPHANRRSLGPFC